MLELLDLDRQIPKELYDRTFPAMKTHLGELQRAARRSGVPVAIVFEGWKAAGKGTAINSLVGALDPRGFKVHPVVAPNDVERYYPWLWRFWNFVPAAGRFAFFDHSWYGRVLDDRVEGSLPEESWRRAYEEIQQFERQLTDSGVVLVKFWLHIDKAEQKRRFKRLSEDRATAWRIGRQERRQHRHYAEWREAVEEMLQRTDTPNAPWTVIEATHKRPIRLKTFETVLTAVENELNRRKAASKPELQPMAEPVPSPYRQETVLDRADLSRALDRPTYEKELAALQSRLYNLEHELYLARIPAVIAYEGWDAAGKGGNIRRLTAGMDPRGYEVIPVAAPTEEDLAHHYLWRFWRNVPKAGHIAIFDRTWYGRVLVERVEGFCAEEDWKRAYQEINEFERQLVEFGTVIVKFWLHISQEEQLRRFEARQQMPDKQWKIGDEDWRNRKKWKQYEVAVTDMLEKTSTTYAPWTILEANDKCYARIKALRTVTQALEAALNKR
ncbi:MAG: phosphate--AMP phosphotransferase [Thermoguttaceae bacterium]